MFPYCWVNGKWIYCQEYSYGRRGIYKNSKMRIYKTYSLPLKGLLGYPIQLLLL